MGKRCLLLLSTLSVPTGRLSVTGRDRGGPDRLCGWLAATLIGLGTAASVQAGAVDQAATPGNPGIAAEPAHSAADTTTDDSVGKAPLLDAADMVRAMAGAMKSLNYEGTFVHVQGSNITSMSILHAGGLKGEFERMRALDGEAREVFRNNDMVTCIWPASESVMVSKSGPKELLPQLEGLLSTNDRYRFHFGAPDRVAGVATHVVNVEPADAHRYGYRFWIDQRNYMLLRSMLLDGRRAVEQLMFTLIEYPDHIDPARFQINRDNALASWLEPKRAQATSGMPSGDEEAAQVDRVGFESLPMGYREVSETYAAMPIDEKPVSHVMISDGMASVSVYVEYAEQGSRQQGVEGHSSMGAVNAFGLRREDSFITAVGEVPAETVKLIAQSVRLHH